MSKDVATAIGTVIAQHLGCSEAEAQTKVAEMRKERRYLEDVWT